MSAHTPGPWTWGDNPNARHHDESTSRGALLGQNYDVVLDGCPNCEVLSCDEANASLIAAAPDLLAALKVLLHATMYRDHPAESELAMAAIAKAEGR